MSPQNTTNRFPGEEKQNWQHGKSLTEAYRKERDIFWKTNLTQVKQRGKCFTLRGNEDRGIQKDKLFGNNSVELSFSFGRVASLQNSEANTKGC